MRRPPSKVHHAITQNRHHPARVELMWRLAPYYERFIPSRCQLKPSIVLQNEVVLNQFFERLSRIIIILKLLAMMSSVIIIMIITGRA